MVQSGLGDDGNATKHCKNLAYRAIRGTTYVAPTHFYYNYQYYLESVPQNSPIIAIRTEHLRQDWNALEEQLSGRSDIMLENMPINNANTEVDQDDLYISQESMDLLCQALCNEISIYKKILSSAKNLDEEQVSASLDTLALKCPVEANLDVCPEAMPIIKNKLKDDRGYYGPEEKEEISE